MPACPSCKALTGFNSPGKTTAGSSRRYCRNCGYSETDSPYKQGRPRKNGTTPLTAYESTKAYRKGETLRQSVYALFDPTLVPEGTDPICAEAFTGTVTARSPQAAQKENPDRLVVLASKVKRIIQSP